MVLRNIKTKAAIEQNMACLVFCMVLVTSAQLIRSSREFIQQLALERNLHIYLSTICNIFKN